MLVKYPASFIFSKTFLYLRYFPVSFRNFQNHFFVKNIQATASEAFVSALTKSPYKVSN